MSRHRPLRIEARTAFVAATVTALLAGLALAVIPMGSRSSVTFERSDGGTVTVEGSRVSLLDSEGASIVPVLLLPAGLAALPLMARGRRRRSLALVSAAALSALSLAGAMSIGLFFLPTVVLLWIGVARSRPSSSPPSSSPPSSSRPPVSDVTTRTATSYDRIAGTYATLFSDELDHKPFDRDLLARLAERWRGAGPVLDIGCGPGHLTAHLAGLGVAASGLDLSPGMVAVARERHPDLHFDVGDFRRLPVADATLAGVVAFYCLIHVGRETLPAVLAELHRALAPGGAVVIAVHAGEGVAKVQDFRGIAVDLEATWFAHPELDAALVAAGFTVEESVQRPPYEGEGTERIYVVARSSGARRERG